MTDSTALVPIEQREIDFQGDRLVAVMVPVEGQAEPAIYVPIRPLCDYIGVSWSGQRERIMRDLVLSEVVEFVRVTRTKSDAGGGRGNPNVLAIPVEYLNGWLFGINASRVKDEVREAVVRYQKDCYRTLWNAFRTDMLAAVGARRALSQVEEVRDFGLALVRLAEEHLALEDRLVRVELAGQESKEQGEQTAARLDQAALVVGGVLREMSDVKQDVAALKRRVAPGEPITEEQASEISQAVKALAMQLTEQDPSKNHFQSIWGELNRRMGVSGYKSIPAARYGEVMAFLDDWRDRLPKNTTTGTP